MFKKIGISFDRVQWTDLTMVPKVTPKGFFGLVLLSKGHLGSLLTVAAAQQDKVSISLPQIF
jgi:hypothetical protein